MEGSQCLRLKITMHYRHLYTFLLPLLLTPQLFARTPQCRDQQRPLVLVHGFLGAGDNYAPLLQQLFRAGYCPEKCFVYDWNSMERVDQSPLLDRFIDSVRALTGAPQVDLIGHSAGGGVCGAYLNDAARMKKVNRYVHAGSSVLKGPAGADGSIPTLNLYSTGDKVVKGGHIPGAENVAFSTYDHFEIITADTVAQAVYGFFNPGKKYKVQKEPRVREAYPVEGRVLSLGQNIPQAGATLRIYTVDDSGKPGPLAEETQTGPNGAFRFNTVRPHTAYLIHCKPVSGRAMAYFLPAIAPHNRLLYLRTLPAQGMISSMLSGLPADSLRAVAVLFSSKHAVIAGKHTLEINGTTLSTPSFADASRTAIAWFLYDGNKNGTSDFSLISPLSGFPFMRAVDVNLPAAAGCFSLFWNNNTYKVPAIPSAEAITIVVLP